MLDDQSLNNVIIKIRLPKQKIIYFVWDAYKGHLLTIQDICTLTDVIAYNDDYPYGNIARYANANGYRYELQCAYAEKDQVTRWNNFALRMYDSRIGRWLSVDSMGQYAPAG